MSYTNFAQLTTEQKTTWSMDLWRQARNMSFLNQFLGKDANSMIQHVTELKKSEKGARAVITLLTDFEGDGIAGDCILEGNEEVMKSFDQVIRIDQLRHANRHEGRMADQKSVVTFRENSRDVLAYWLADRSDQLAFLTLGGLAYSTKNAGGTRIGSDLSYLEFAADVTAPSAKRYLVWDRANMDFVTNTANSSLVGGAIGTGDYPCWEAFVQLKAYAKDNYIRGVKSKGGEEVFHIFLSPQAMAKLKLDSTFMLNLRHAMPRGEANRPSRSTTSCSTSSATCRTPVLLPPVASGAAVTSMVAACCSAAHRRWVLPTSAIRSGSRRASTTITSKASRLARSSAS